MEILKRPLALGILATLALAACGRATLPSAPLAGSLSANVGLDAAAKAGYKAYFGIEHTHVAQNGDDGQGSLEDAYTFARDRAKMDFLGVSSHAHMITDQGYAVMKETAKRVTVNGKFVALLAQEWSSISKGGHINIVNADSRCDMPNGAWDEFYKRWLPAHPEVAFIQFNHPHPDNPLEFGGIKFLPTAHERPSVVAQDKFSAMALLNGPGKYEKPDMNGEIDRWDKGVNGLNYEAEYFDFLNRGWRIGAIGDQDNHVKNWGLAAPTRTGVWATSLSSADLLNGFKARRTFAAFDPNVQLWLAMDGHDMGSWVAKAGKTHEVTVTVTDPDTVIKRIELYGDTDGVGGRPAAIVAKTDVNKKSASWKISLPAASGEAWYLAKVVYDDKKAWAWSSPIWYGAGGAKE